ncbi:MAG TPA: MarR family transcriptional regulator, partial [Pseudonocardiaceae bacterium]
MSASHDRAQRSADHSAMSLLGISASPGADGVGVGHNGEVMATEDIGWLVSHLQTVVAASPVVWAGRGMTLLQLTALHLISTLAPVTLTDLAQALGTRPPATSAMVDRLTHAGLVCRTPD